MSQWSYDLSKVLCNLFFRLGFGLEVRGQSHVPREGAFILASNHLSFLDPPVLGAACPRRVSFLARDSLFKNKLLSLYMRSVGVIPLRRGESDIAAMRLAISRLSQGDVVCLFPEGTRGETPDIREAKRGVDILARKAKVPVVPVVVQGTFDALPRHRNKLRRAKIRVAFGPPIAYTEPSNSAAFQASPNRLATEGSSSQQASRSIAEQVTRHWRELAADMAHSAAE